MDTQESRYMTPQEIQRATNDMQALLSEVLQQQRLLNHLIPTEITVYQPTGVLSRFLRGFAPLVLGTKPDQLVTMTGFAFGDDHPSRNGVIVQHGSTIKVATRLEFPRSSRELYILHDLKDYVRIWLVSDDDHYQSGDMARRLINDTRYQIEQLLPNEHPSRRTEYDWRGSLR